MDKNQATGLLLFAAVILVYSLFFASAPEPIQEDPVPVKSETQEISDASAAPTIEPDSVSDLKIQ